MPKPIIERRRYERYETELEIVFHHKYKLQTKVSFRLIRPESSGLKKYKGITRDVSVEGLGFNSPKKLITGEILELELYLPEQKKPLRMNGEVRWSMLALSKKPEAYKYDTGVRLLTIGRKKVIDTVRFDKEYGVYWSAVLDSIFGNFKIIAKKLRRKAAK